MKSTSKVFVFASSSGSGKYQTLLYSDGTTSCDCKGWTRRNPPGGRSCKHTRFVECGMGEQMAESYRKMSQKIDASRLFTNVGSKRPQETTKQQPFAVTRQFELETE